MKISLMADDVPYFSQRNNELEPNSSCNVTAMVQALCLLRMDFPLSKFSQPEDALRDLIVSGGGDPTIHADLSKGFNEWAGRQMTRFTTAARIDDIILDLKNGKPSVMSGTFPYYNNDSIKNIGHIVTISGVELSEDNAPLSWEVQDPYGDTWKNWSGSGRNIKFSHEQFINYLKPLKGKDKWRHYFF
ncbi:MAG: C39 family peptidase [Spirochaetaceae bacterium]|jgi:hypothetical protein|nr:C39 family peptidase [Spirochaetaceae bacterium]